MSLATLAVLGGLGYLFLQGGGLSQFAVSPGSTGPPGRPHGLSGNGSPGSWLPGNAPPSTREPYHTVSTAPPSPPPAATPPAGSAAGPTIRLASFNIQVFGNTKAGKAYVMEALAQIILQFDVVAIQEIRSQNEYLIPNFVDLINRSASGKHYDHVIGPRLGYTNVKEQYAFIFNADRIKVGRQSVYTVGDPDDLLHREPLVASFKVLGPDPDEAFSFTLVNIHTDPDEVKQEVDALAEVYRVVRRSGEEDDIILVGDFNADDRHLGRLGQVPGIRPLISGVATNTRQTAQYDNLIIHRHSTTEYAGRSGVFDVMRFINKNLEQTLQVSDHLPVWAEFSVYERDFAGRIASRRRGGR